MPVAVVTDSTAYLPEDLVSDLGIDVVPLYVVLAGRSGREGCDIGPADVARAMAARGQSVSTSRPTTGDFVAAYRRTLDAGADLTRGRGWRELCGWGVVLMRVWIPIRVGAFQMGGCEDRDCHCIGHRKTRMMLAFAATGV